MIAVSAPATSRKVDYDEGAASYARHRGVHPGVVQEMLAVGRIAATTRVLDVGCGTGNYARALTRESGCRISGVDPSAGMLGRARDAVAWDTLVQGSAERLPFPDRSFDIVLSTDVIHHVADRAAYFREAARVLCPGGQIATVTDSHEDIIRRRPLSSHFPETAPIELARYPAVSLLLGEMASAGFTTLAVTEVTREYALSDIQAYRDRAFSSLLLIEDEAHRQGIARMEEELAHGPIPCISLYTVIWGVLPGA